MSLEEVKKALEIKDVGQLKTQLSKLISEQVPLAKSKPAVSYLVDNISKLNNDQTLEVANHAISLLSGGWQIQFDMEDAKFKTEIANVHSARSENDQAARILEKINLEQTNRNVENKEKVDTWLNIAENWFDADDSVNAEKFVNKAAHIMHLIQERELQIRYKNFQAKILDSKRKFHLAAWEYYGISNYGELGQEDQLAMLKQAMTCAILTPAGDQKYRLMSALHKDERSKQIDPQFDYLDQLFNGSIVKWADAKVFQDECLEDHQKAVGQDGYSVLQKSLLEHNIQILSKIFLNISFSSLAKQLDIQPEKAELIISEMVREDRIKCQLDQLTNSIDFTIELEAKGVQVAGGQAALEENAELEAALVEDRPSFNDIKVHDINNAIHSVCSNIDSLIQDILKERPELQKFDTHIIE